MKKIEFYSADQNNGMIAIFELLKVDVPSYVNVAKKPTAWVFRDFVESVDDVLDVWMIRSHSESDESEWHGKTFDDVNGHVAVALWKTLRH